MAGAEDVGRAVDALVKACGGLHYAYNNAGVFSPAFTADLAESEFARVVDVNLTGVFRCRSSRPSRRGTQARSASLEKCGFEPVNVPGGLGD